MKEKGLSVDKRGLKYENNWFEEEKDVQSLLNRNPEIDHKSEANLSDIKSYSKFRDLIKNDPSRYLYLQDI